MGTNISAFAIPSSLEKNKKLRKVACSLKISVYNIFLCCILLVLLYNYHHLVFTHKKTKQIFFFLLHFAHPNSLTTIIILLSYYIIPTYFKNHNSTFNLHSVLIFMLSLLF